MSSLLRLNKKRFPYSNLDGSSVLVTALSDVKSCNFNDCINGERKKQEMKEFLEESKIKIRKKCSIFFLYFSNHYDCKLCNNGTGICRHIYQEVICVNVFKIQVNCMVNVT
jgi:hypothetical protein